MRFVNETSERFVILQDPNPCANEYLYSKFRQSFPAYFLFKNVFYENKKLTRNVLPSGHSRTNTKSSKHFCGSDGNNKFSAAVAREIFLIKLFVPKIHIINNVLLKNPPLNYVDTEH